MFTFLLSNAQPELSGDTTAFGNAIHFFYNKINSSAQIYSGKEYYKYEPGVKGFPFYINDAMQNGDIFYDGTLYKNIPMMFDEVRQVIVAYQNNQQDVMQLLSEKIQYFTLARHRFETVSQIEGSDNNITKGLYDVMYSGKASILIKRIKKIKKGLHAEDPYTFTEEDEYYIKNGKSLYLINNKNSVLNALNDKKDQVQSYIRKNRLRFKKHIEKDIIQTAEYYSSLN